MDMSKPAFLVIGKLRRPHGVRGEVQMEVYTDFPERLRPGKQVFIGDDHIPALVEKVRQHKNLLILSFRGYDSCETVEPFRNMLVFVSTKNLPALPEGEFYHHELIGLKVIDIQSGYIGSLVEILETGANDVYLVKDQEGKEILLPAINNVIISIDLDEGVMKVRQPEYL